MFPSPVPAFLAAAIVALLLTPRCRQLALAVGLVDRPAARKLQLVAIPYLGGVAVAVGVLTGLLLAPGYGFRLGAMALIAVGLCAVGLLDDHRQLRPLTRLILEVGAAGATLALGLRLEATGIAVVDAALTVLWIVGLTNAANLLDNMDGLGAGVAGSISLSSLVLLAGGLAVAEQALAAAMAGACAGFLAYNKRPASIYMGDAGSLFLGYLVSVLTLTAVRPLPPAPRLVVPLMLAAVPLTDTVTVVLARLRRGISPAQAGKDHLSHRLVRRGLTPGRAVLVLLGVSLIVGVLGALAGRDVVPLPVAVMTAVAVLGLLLWSALPAPVYDTPVIGLPARLRTALAAGVAGAVFAGAAGLVPARRSSGPPFLHSDAFGPVQLVLLLAAFATLAAVVGAVVRGRIRTAGPSTGDRETIPHLLNPHKEGLHR